MQRFNFKLLTSGASITSGDASLESPQSLVLDELCGLRDRLLADAAHPLSLIAGQPGELLGDYEARREASPLGRMFRIANRLHEQTDAVVVLGDRCSLSGARMLRDACCHPYHNEMSRGWRGSKPRMYFEGDAADNDALAALLERITMIHDNDPPVQNQWAVVLLCQPNDAPELRLAAEHFVAALGKSLAHAEHVTPADVTFLVVAGSDVGGDVGSAATRFAHDDCFDVPMAIAGTRSVLSATGVLPAAILGLDCIELLGGARAMTEHFIAAPLEENAVLQYAAMHCMAFAECPGSTREMFFANKALVSAGHWWEMLLGECWHPRRRPLTAVTSPADYSPANASDIGGRCVCQCVVRSWRSDPLIASENQSAPSSGGDIVSMPQLALDQIQHAETALAGRAIRAGRFELPEINTRSMGQLIQLLMLASVVESNLIQP